MKIKLRHPLVKVTFTALLLVSCTVGPNYKRPGVDSPGAYRRAATDTNVTASAESFADFGWWEAFNDPQLTAFICEALTNSWDIKIAAARVLQAEAAAPVSSEPRSGEFKVTEAAPQPTPSGGAASS